jgi:ABC-type Na+ efflux pump permease subunit
MTTVTAAPATIPLTRPRAPARPSRPAAWATLARRRISLSAHTPREILAPLATPLLFALVIAPALAKITALPAWLAWVARALPTTHVLALLRYGALDRTGAGLHDIWGVTSTTTDAALSLLVLAGWAILITAAAIRVFTRSAVN